MAKVARKHSATGKIRGKIPAHLVLRDASGALRFVRATPELRRRQRAAIARLQQRIDDQAIQAGRMAPWRRDELKDGTKPDPVTLTPIGPTTRRYDIRSAEGFSWIVKHETALQVARQVKAGATKRGRKIQETAQKTRSTVAALATELRAKRPYHRSSASTEWLKTKIAGELGCAPLTVDRHLKALGIR